MIPSKFGKITWFVDEKNEDIEDDKEDNIEEEKNIFVRLLNGNIFPFVIDFRNISRKNRENHMTDQVLSTFKTNYGLIFRKHRVKLIKTEEEDTYFLVQESPNVKDYLVEDEDTGSLEISLRYFTSSNKNSLYGLINLEDLIDWLESINQGDRTYESVIIKDCTKRYEYKLFDIVSNKLRGDNTIPIIPFSDYTDECTEKELERFFSLINEKLGATTIEWNGPKLPIEIFINAFPNVKKLSVSFPIEQSDMQKISWFSFLEEIECIVPSYLEDMNEMYLDKIKIKFVNYIWNNNKIQKVTMGEFL